MSTFQYAPWHVIEHGESFTVEDEAKRRVAFVYFSDDRGRASSMHRLMKEDARKVADAIAGLASAVQAR